MNIKQYFEKYPHYLFYDEEQDEYFSDLDDWIEDFISMADDEDIQTRIEHIENNNFRLFGTDEIMFGIDGDDLIDWVDERMYEQVDEWEGGLEKEAEKAIKHFVELYNMQYGIVRYAPNDERLEFSEEEKKYLQGCLIEVLEEVKE